MPNKTCSWGLCRSDSRHKSRPDMEGVTFLPFPNPKKQFSRCKQWVLSCNWPHQRLTVDKITKNYYVCSKHFEDGNPDPVSSRGAYGSPYKSIDPQETIKELAEVKDTSKTTHSDTPGCFGGLNIPFCVAEEWKDWQEREEEIKENRERISTATCGDMRGNLSRSNVSLSVIDRPLFIWRSSEEIEQEFLENRKTSIRYDDKHGSTDSTTYSNKCGNTDSTTRSNERGNTGVFTVPACLSLSRESLYRLDAFEERNGELSADESTSTSCSDENDEECLSTLRVHFPPQDNQRFKDVITSAVDKTDPHMRRISTSDNLRLECTNVKDEPYDTGLDKAKEKKCDQNISSMELGPIVNTLSNSKPHKQESTKFKDRGTNSKATIDNPILKSTDIKEETDDTGNESIIREKPDQNIYPLKRGPIDFSPSTSQSPCNDPAEEFDSESTGSSGETFDSLYDNHTDVKDEFNDTSKDDKVTEKSDLDVASSKLVPKVHTASKSQPHRKDPSRNLDSSMSTLDNLHIQHTDIKEESDEECLSMLSVHFASENNPRSKGVIKNSSDQTNPEMKSIQGTDGIHLKHKAIKSKSADKGRFHPLRKKSDVDAAFSALRPNAQSILRRHALCSSLRQNVESKTDPLVRANRMFDTLHQEDTDYNSLNNNSIKESDIDEDPRLEIITTMKSFPNKAPITHLGCYKDSTKGPIKTFGNGTNVKKGFDDNCMDELIEDEQDLGTLPLKLKPNHQSTADSLASKNNLLQNLDPGADSHKKTVKSFDNLLIEGTDVQEERDNTCQREKIKTKHKVQDILSMEHEPTVQSPHTRISTHNSSYMSNLSIESQLECYSNTKDITGISYHKPNSYDSSTQNHNDEGYLNKISARELISFIPNFDILLGEDEEDSSSLQPKLEPSSSTPSDMFSCEAENKSVEPTLENGLDDVDNKTSLSNASEKHSNALSNQASSAPKEEHKCRICGKTFTKSSRLYVHLKKQKCNANGFGCVVCHKIFASRVTAVEHEKMHRGEERTKLKPKECGICGKFLSDSSALKYHIRTHLSEKPYKCEICDYRCKNKRNLTNHHRSTHTTEKPYLCELCGKNFKHFASFHKHTQLHQKKSSRVNKAIAKLIV